MSGIFIIKGMSLKLSNFRISFDENGNLTGSNLELSVGYDACIAWAEIALDLRQAAVERMQERRAVWSSSTNDQEKANSLEREFAASMQAVVAAVTCIDALYDQILPLAALDTATKERWMKNRTARHKQIAETLRSAFRIEPASTKQLRVLLHGMYQLRDVAVHPSSAALPPRPHPELPSQVEWRFTSFRGDVADLFVCSAVGLLWDLTQFKRFRSDELAKFMAEFTIKVQTLLPDGKPTALTTSVDFFVPPRTKVSCSSSDTRSIAARCKSFARTIGRRLRGLFARGSD